jgi:glutaredoxin
MFHDIEGFNLKSCPFKSALRSTATRQNTQDSSLNVQSDPERIIIEATQKREVNLYFNCEIGYLYRTVELLCMR